MTQLELNSSELNHIISALKHNEQRILKMNDSAKQPLPQPIEDMSHEIHYLIEKLEVIYPKALEEEEEKKNK